MSADPAVAAAQQVWPKGHGGRKLVVNRPRTYMEAAARAALSPVREHIEKILSGLDATALYDELEFIYRQLLGGHCEECRAR